MASIDQKRIGLLAYKNSSTYLSTTVRHVGVSNDFINAKKLESFASVLTYEPTNCYRLYEGNLFVLWCPSAANILASGGMKCNQDILF